MTTTPAKGTSPVLVMVRMYVNLPPATTGSGLAALTMTKEGDSALVGRALINDRDSKMAIRTPSTASTSRIPLL